MLHEVIVTIGVEPMSVEAGEGHDLVTWQLRHGADRALVRCVIGEIELFVAYRLKVPRSCHHGVQALAQFLIRTRVLVLCFVALGYRLLTNK